MEYYCIMVKTGEETAFKEKAQDAFLGYYPDTEFFFFQRRLRTNKGKYFDAPLFPGYLFFRIEKLSDDFILLLKSLKSFYRILIGFKSAVPSGEKGACNIRSAGGA